MARVPKKAKAAEAVGDRRRRDLLVAAYELIAQKGFEGLRTRDIAARADVNISTLHYYFGTKDALLHAVVSFVAEKFVGEGELVRAPRDRTLRHHLDRVHATFERNPELAVVLQQLSLRAQRDSATRKALRPIFRLWNRQLENVLRAETGGEHGPSDVRELALVVTSFVTGAITQRGVNAGAVDFQRLSRRLERLVAGRR